MQNKEILVEIYLIQNLKIQFQENAIIVEAVNGIDRIDSNIGYIKENCVSCCWTCNKMKNNFSQKEFLEKINKIYCNFKSSTTIPQGSTSQANGDGNGENPKKQD